MEKRLILEIPKNLGLEKLLEIIALVPDNWGRGAGTLRASRSLIQEGRVAFNTELEMREDTAFTSAHKSGEAYHPLEVLTLEKLPECVVINKWGGMGSFSVKSVKFIFSSFLKRGYSGWADFHYSNSGDWRDENGSIRFDIRDLLIDDGIAPTISFEANREYFMSGTQAVIDLYQSLGFQKFIPQGE